MSGQAQARIAQRGQAVRIAAWSFAGAILLLPLIAMQFTDEVNWDAADFVFAGVLLLSVGGAFELAVRRTGDRYYRAGAGVALLAAFLLIWINAAVGIIGSENNDANRMFAGVLAVGLVGAVLARFRPRGMARALVATAVAQALVGVIALARGLGATDPGEPVEVLALTGFFAGMWLAAAWLFGRAAGEVVGPRTA